MSFIQLISKLAEDNDVLCVIDFITRVEDNIELPLCVVTEEDNNEVS